MSLFQFSAAVGGFAKANSTDDGEGLTREDAEQINSILDDIEDGKIKL